MRQVDEVDKSLHSSKADSAAAGQYHRSKRIYHDNYRVLFNHISDAVAVFAVFNGGQDLVFVDFNPAAEKIDNVKREQVIGKNLLSVFPGAQDIGLLKVLRRVWQTGRPEYFASKCYGDSPINGLRENSVYKLPTGQIAVIYNRQADKSKTEQELRLICEAVEQTKEGIGIIDLNGCLCFVNSALGRMHGFAPEDLMGRHYSVLYADKQWLSEESVMEKLAVRGDYERQINHVRRDGSEFPALTHLTVLRNKDSKFIGVIGIVRDLTENKRAQDEMILEKNKLKAILSSMQSSVTIRDLDHTIIYQNDHSIDRSGNRIGLKCYELKGMEDHCPDCPVQKSITEGVSRYTIKRQKDDSGRITYWEHFTNPIRGADGKINSCLKISTDITDRKRAERQLVANQQRLRDLACQLSLSEERQRRQIAENLHDQISQWLALSVLKLDILRDGVDPSLAEQVDDVSQSIHQTIAAIRSMIFDLSSPTLYKFGLRAAVFEFITELFGRHPKIKCEFQADKQVVELTQDMNVLLFQAVRELLFNVIKYAKAGNVLVEMKADQGFYLVTVKDDGVGFDTSKIGTFHRNGGFGIFNIMERLDYVGGSLEIFSEPGKGSSFTMKVPLKAEIVISI